MCVLIACGLETSTLKWPRPELGCYTTERKKEQDTRGVGYLVGGWNIKNNCFSYFYMH
jgi:hypothetical protein